MLTKEVILKEMEILKNKFDEIQEKRSMHVEEIKKIDAECLKLDGAFMAFQKILENFIIDENEKTPE